MSRLNPVVQPVGEAHAELLVTRRYVFAIGGGARAPGAVDNAALSVIRGVSEVHGRVSRLVVVVSPVVEDVVTKAVDVDEVADGGKRIHEPLRALRFRFGERNGADVDLRARSR